MLFNLQPNQALVVFQNVRVKSRLARDDRLDAAAHFILIEFAVGKTRVEKLAGDLSHFFVELHWEKKKLGDGIFYAATWRAVSSERRRWSSGERTLPVTFEVVSITSRPTSRLSSLSI